MSADNYEPPKTTRDRDLIAEVLSDVACLPESRISGVARGTRLAGYQVVSRLGRGAFAEVWRAREETLERDVALKLLRRREGEDVNAAFNEYLREARALSAAEHDHVVRIWNAGILDYPRLPFISMELCNGSADTRVALASKEAARTLADVARAVASAHARGILHRDIKPSNILFDSRGRAKLSDFGLSRPGMFLPSASPRMPDETQSVYFSDKGLSFLGTPAYMAPEQAVGEQATPLSDVYALGATLYYLLTGASPYSFGASASSGSVRELFARIANPSHHPNPLPNSVPRTLMRICQKAMSKAPDDRYQTSEKLADDLEAWLSRRPTSVDPRGSVRRAALAARRNPIPTMLGFAVALSIIVGTTLSIQFARQAKQEAATTTITNRFWEGVVGAHELADSGRELQYVDVLDYASERLVDAFKGRPLAEARVRLTIGGAYSDLGIRDKALPHLEKAYRIRLDLLGNRDLETLAAADRLAELFIETRGGDAVGMLTHVLEARQDIQGTAHADTLKTQCILANALGNRWIKRYDEAEALYSATLSACINVLGEDHPTTHELLCDIGSYYVWRKQYARAEGFLHRGFAVLSRVRGENHPSSIAAMFRIAHLYRAWGQKDRAAELFRDVLDRADRVLPAAHALRWDIRHHFGRLLTSLNKFEESEDLLTAACAGFDFSTGKEDTRARDSRMALAELYDKWEQDEKAVKAIRNVVALNLDPVTTLYWKNKLATVLLRDGRVNDAKVLYDEVLREISSARRFGLGWREPWFNGSYGSYLVAAGAVQEGKEAIRQGFEGIWRLAAGYTDATPDGAALIRSMIALCRDSDTTGECDAYANLLERWQARDKYGRGMIRLGDLREAEKYLLAREEDLTSRLGMSDLQSIDVIEATAEMYERMDRWQEAGARYALVVDCKYASNALPADLARTKIDLGRMLIKLGYLDQARDAIGSANAIVAAEPSTRWIRGWAQCVEGFLLFQQRQFDQAETVLQDGFELLAHGDGIEVQEEEQRMAAEWIVELYDARESAEPGKGYAELASEWQSALAQLRDPG